MKTEVPGYERLTAVLQAALDQASKGKGAERHANDLPFEEQRMLGISHLLDSDGGLAYQACKKVAESRGMAHDARERELLGAINYIAGMVIFHQDRQPKAAEPLVLRDYQVPAPMLAGYKCSIELSTYELNALKDKGQADKFFADAVAFGIGIMVDGKRVDPGAIVKEPQRPRHVCPACGLGHSIGQCNPMTPEEEALHALSLEELAIQQGGKPMDDAAPEVDWERAPEWAMHLLLCEHDGTLWWCENYCAGGRVQSCDAGVGGELNQNGSVYSHDEVAPCKLIATRSNGEKP